MSWIAVDKNRDEFIYDDEPHRNVDYDKFHPRFGSDYVIVPSGTSLKLTGKQMTWEDEPVELT